MSMFLRVPDGISINDFVYFSAQAVGAIDL